MDEYKHACTDCSFKCTNKHDLKVKEDLINNLRDGVPFQKLPKYRHGWGGSDPCLDFCEGFVHMH